MKKFLLLVLAGVFAHLAPAQTIRRVNNTPGLNDPNVYATAQAAHDASVDGDIIYLEPAGGEFGVSYGTLSVNRRVHIYGNGYFLDKGNPDVPFDKRPASLSGVNFESGGANSTIIGVGTGVMYINVNNITVSRCYITGIAFGVGYQVINGQNVAVSSGTDCTVTRCHLGSVTGPNSSSANVLIPGTGIVLTNNILFNILSGLRNSVINYNTLRFGGAFFRYITNSAFTNNIIDARLAIAGTPFFDSQTSLGNSISNNISVGNTSLPAGNGNINGADPLTTFVNPNPYVLNQTQGDAVFKLAPNSPAKTVAAGGGEAGAFGGGSPYLLSGLPPIPIVTNYTNSGSGNANTPLSVTISVRSNN